MDALKEDMRVVGLNKGNTEERVRWRQLICCGDLYKKQPKGRGWAN